MKEQVIRLEHHDDISTTREKLGWARANRVLLVFPEDPRYAVLQEKLDIILLQREATRQNIQLALITRDPIVRDHAADIGMAAFASIDDSRSYFWESAQAELAIQRSTRLTVLDADLIEEGTRLRAQERSSRIGAQRAFGSLLATIAILSLLAAGLMLVPSATVRLTPAANQVAVTTTLVADPTIEEIDSALGLVPARLIGVEVEGETSIQTSGTSEQPAGRATGVVLLTNLVPDEVVIPAGTVVRTSAAIPVEFVTLAEATLAEEIGATVQIPIEAQVGGFEGNLPPGRINRIEGSFANAVAVTNPEATVGGNVAEVIAVDQSDLDRLRSLLLQQLQQRAYAQMQIDPFIALQDTEFVPVESLTVILVHSETYDNYIGEATDEATLTMRVTIQAVAIDESLVQKLVFEQLGGKVGNGYRITSESLAYRLGEIVNVTDDLQVSFIVQGVGDVAASIQPGNVQQILRGRTIANAQDRLDRELALAAPPRVEIQPGFWPVLPFAPARITVIIEGQA